MPAVVAQTLCVVVDLAFVEVDRKARCANDDWHRGGSGASIMTMPQFGRHGRDPAFLSSRTPAQPSWLSLLMRTCEVVAPLTSSLMYVV